MTTFRRGRVLTRRAPSHPMLKLPAVDLEPSHVLVATIVVASMVMLLQAAFGAFHAVWAAGLTLAALLGAGALVVRRVAWPASPRRLVAALALGLVALTLRWSPFLITEGGQDQGIYVAMSAHLSRTQGLAITDAVRESLPKEQRAGYDELNNSFGIVLAKRVEGWHQPGVYIVDLERSAYAFQFYALHPLWMALFAGIAGDDQRVYSLVFLSLANLLMLSLLAYQLAGRRPAAGFIAAALLAINPVHVFLSRFPVSENVSVFFTAAAFYGLVRYLKAPPGRPGAALELAFSALAWAGAFFTHIGAFMYAPLIGGAVLAGLVRAGSPSERRAPAAYGLAVVAAWGLALAFNTRWSFPYSFDVYRSLFGDAAALLLLERGWMVVAAAAVLVVAAAWLVGARRAAFLEVTSSPRVRAAAAGALVVVVFAAVAWALFNAWRLGFTTHFAADPWIGQRWALANAGWHGFMHSAIAALAVYVSPFLLVFCLAMLWLRRAALDAYEGFLIAVVALFFVVRVAMDGITPYYFYSRYLGQEVVPYVLVLAAVWLQRLLAAGTARARAAAGAVFALALGWQAWALAPQYPGGEMHRVHASLKPIAAQIRERDLLMLAGGDYPALRTALEYYYGRNIMRVDAAQLREAIRRHAPTWADLYVLSDADNLPGLAYLGAHAIRHDRYSDVGALNTLPRHSSGREFRFYLYRANRAEAARLRPGDTVSFAASGHLQPYLGAGWSGQEQFMRWTEGPTATLLLPLAEPGLLRFEVRAHNCVPVQVRVNGEPRARWTFTDCARYGERQLAIQREDLAAASGGVVQVTFDMPTVKAPAEVSPAASDQRKLGISVTRILLERPAP